MHFQLQHMTLNLQHGKPVQVHEDPGLLLGTQTRIVVRNSIHFPFLSSVRAIIEMLLMQGKVPDVDVTLELYQLLLEAGSQLRQPVALEEQLLKHNGLSSDVGKSMLQLLQVMYRFPRCNPN